MKNGYLSNMKNYLLLTLLSFAFLSSTAGQSSTIEVSPQFYPANNAYVSDVFEFDISKHNLEFIALSCYHFDLEEIPVYYRLRRGNQLTGWIKFEQVHEFVASTRSAYRAKPIKEPFIAIQFKTKDELQSPFTARFFLGGVKNFTPPSMNKSLNCDIPIVCERDCWCPTCPIDVSPEFTEPTHLIVHHSAAHNGLNNYAMVAESIWDFHVNTNGWDDIGYNWLIDPDGVLYQGRPDGYQGAHFSCINENTVGICVLGDFTSITPTEEALTTLVNLLAYEATEHEIDIEAESYHETGEFTLTNVAGHRDSSGSLNACSSTVCPGDSFYPMLPEIRGRVAELPCYAEPVSTTENIEDLVVSIFPNPVDDQFYINSGSERNETFELLNIHGVSIGLVRSGQMNELGHLESGIYFLVRDDEIVDRIIKN